MKRRFIEVNAGGTNYYICEYKKHWWSEWTPLKERDCEYSIKLFTYRETLDLGYYFSTFTD